MIKFYVDHQPISSSSFETTKQNMTLAETQA